MATANINWSFSPQSSAAPIANCTFSVTVTRDGLALPAFSVITNATGAASGVYQDATASGTVTHQYRFTPQLSGCAANCTAQPATVNWNCSGTAVPIVITPAAPNCPVTADSFVFCGGTNAAQQVAVGDTVALAQNFGFATTVTVSGVPPGMTASTTSTGATVTGSPTTAGTYNVQFIGSKTGCTNCVVTYPLIVGAAAASATQSIRTLRGARVYTPGSTTSFNAEDQILEVSLSGPAGKTFQLVGTGSVNATSPILTIPPSGVFTYSPLIGQANSYSTAWGFVPAGSNPIALINPGTTTITGTTCMTLAVTQSGSSYTITVSAPAGTTAVPFTLDFGGASFGGSASCAANSFGTSNGALTTASGGGGNVFVFGPVSVTAPYSAAIRLSTNAGTSINTHVVCGPACAQVTF